MDYSCALIRHRIVLDIVILVNRISFENKPLTLTIAKQ